MSAGPWLAGGALLLLAAVGYAYWPLRKWFQRKLDPQWDAMARVIEFPEEEEEAAERDLFVSSTVMRDACDVVWYEKAPEPPSELLGALPRGSVVYVNAKHMERFCREVLPALPQPVVLVSGCDTVSSCVPGHEEILASPKILHWYLQNYELAPEHVGDRVTPLPLGMNFHKLETYPATNTAGDTGYPSRHGNQQLTLLSIRETIAPLTERPLRVYANFHLSMDTFLRSSQARERRQHRAEARDALRGNPCVDFQARFLPRNEIWRRHRDATFEVSPHGNGLDCHRTWEALLLKCIPIVKTSTLDPLYEGLPVAIVEDWSEVEPAHLARWRDRHAGAFDGPIDPRLYSRYWIERFQGHRDEA